MIICVIISSHRCFCVSALLEPPTDIYVPKLDFGAGIPLPSWDQHKMLVLLIVGVLPDLK